MTTYTTAVPVFGSFTLHPARDRSAVLSAADLQQQQKDYCFTSIRTRHPTTCGTELLVVLLLYIA